MKLSVKASPELLDSVQIVAEDVARALGFPSGRPSFEAYLSVSKQVKQIRNVGRKTGLDLRKSKILEIGSGLGMFLCVANKLGLNCYGLSPSCGVYQKQFDAAQQLLSQNGISTDRILDALGEQIPLESDSMDLVVSFDVLEHVQDPLAVLRESLRVLKPGGFLYGFAGTSCYWWEWHYAIPWFPGMPRWAAKHWVRLFGRNPDFLRDLNLMTTHRFRKYLLSLQDATLVHFCDDAPDGSLGEADGNKWVDEVECNELVEMTQSVRGSRWGLKWCGLVMRPTMQKLSRNFAIFPSLEIVVRKHKK